VELREVHALPLKCVLDGQQVHAVLVGGELDAPGEPRL